MPSEGKFYFLKKTYKKRNIQVYIAIVSASQIQSCKIELQFHPHLNKRSLCVFALHILRSILVHAATSVDYTQTLVSLIMEQIKKNEREESKRQERKQGVYD